MYEGRTPPPQLTLLLSLLLLLSFPAKIEVTVLKSLLFPPPTWLNSPSPSRPPPPPWLLLLLQGSTISQTLLCFLRRVWTGIWTGTELNHRRKKTLQLTIKYTMNLPTLLSWDIVTRLQWHFLAVFSKNNYYY